MLYEAEVNFVFSGTVSIETESFKDAVIALDNDFGLVLGRDIHTSNEREILDWNFDMHPDKIIKSITQADDQE